MENPAETISLDFKVAGTRARSSAILILPQDALALYVFAHGAGAGMSHAFMESVAHRLAGKGIATFRYQFPYTEEGRRRPDPPHLLHATVRSAVETASGKIGDLPVFAGGKSLGGRMTSTAAASQSLLTVRGLVFLGFPLHAVGKPSIQRAEHLYRIEFPMLFLQGTRDGLANLDLLRPVCDELGERATLHVIEGGDHSFKVLKRSGRTQEEALEELSQAIAAWIRNLL